MTCRPQPSPHHATSRHTLGWRRAVRGYSALQSGLLRYIDGRLESAQAVVTDGERLVSIYVVRNPDKLARIAPELLALHEGNP